MLTHPPFCRSKTLEVGVSARVTLNSHSINRLTPCFPRFDIEYEFVKVEGHTNDKFNEEADRLAKDALGIK